MDSAIPSTVELWHRSMRGAVVYEFIMEELSLREDAHDSVDDRASRAEKRDMEDGQRNSRD